MNLELPEIETLRRELEREFATRKIKAVEVKAMKSLPNHRTKKDFSSLLEGAKVVTAERHKMKLIIRFDNEHALIISLGENGKLAKVTASTSVDSDVVVRISFTQGGDLRIHDSDASSVIHAVADDDVAAAVHDEERTGFDLQSEPLSWVEFGRIVNAYEMPLKLLLTDQSIFIGIGDIYSNEMLFDAGLKHDRMSNELSTQEVRRLYRSVAGILHDATKNKGTSLEDRPFHDLAGEPGEYASTLKVFGKAGELSPRSRLPIKKTKLKGQVVFYCDTQV